VNRKISQEAIDFVVADKLYDVTSYIEAIRTLLERAHNIAESLAFMGGYEDAEYISSGCVKALAEAGASEILTAQAFLESWYKEMLEDANAANSNADVMEVKP
jgi:hypothetical protein